MTFLCRWRAIARKPRRSKSAPISFGSGAAYSMNSNPAVPMGFSQGIADIIATPCDLEALMKEILIAGGGIGGLAAALALARKGRKVRVLEKAAEFGEIGYGIQMGPNVSRMLDRLGILKTLEPHAVFPDALILVDAVDNRELTRITLGKRFL